MGYTTEFEGEFEITPPLTLDQLTEINNFMEGRHGGNINVYEGFPSFHCDWETNGDTIKWNESEKSYKMYEWIKLLNEKFFKPWGCMLTGDISAQGENKDDRWGMRAKDGEIKRLRAVINLIEED